jgi:hypothetical protein
VESDPYQPHDVPHVQVHDDEQLFNADLAAHNILMTPVTPSPGRGRGNGRRPGPGLNPQKEGM